MLLILLALACRPESAPDRPPVDSLADAPPPAEPPIAAEPPAPSGIPEVAEPGPDPASATATPADLYASCRDRVENPQVAGECKTDADCAKTGCGGEVCTSAKGAMDLMTTCEVRPCFRVLDACGCHEGMCTWTLLPQNPGPALHPLPDIK